MKYPVWYYDEFIFFYFQWISCEEDRDWILHPEEGGDEKAEKCKNFLFSLRKTQSIILPEGNIKCKYNLIEFLCEL